MFCNLKDELFILILFLQWQVTNYVIVSLPGDLSCQARWMKVCTDSCNCCGESGQMLDYFKQFMDYLYLILFYLAHSQLQYPQNTRKKTKNNKKTLYTADMLGGPKKRELSYWGQRFSWPFTEKIVVTAQSKMQQKINLPVYLWEKLQYIILMQAVRIKDKLT